MASVEIIKIENLSKRFGEKIILDEVSLSVLQGENLVVFGQSGTGKSVLLKCIIGLLKPDNGNVFIKGKDVTELSLKELNDIRKHTSFLFQGAALYDSMTVRENLEFPLRKQNIPQAKKDELVIQALESVGLTSALELIPDELSGGMKRRVALARAIILNPKIIIYDEPTTGLDPITAKEIMQLMRDIQKIYGSSALIITHDVDCSRVIADRMILLIDGVNYAEGTFLELSKSKDKQVQAFFK